VVHHFHHRINTKMREGRQWLHVEEMAQRTKERKIMARTYLFARASFSLIRQNLLHRTILHRVRLVHKPNRQTDAFLAPYCASVISHCYSRVPIVMFIQWIAIFWEIFVMHCKIKSFLLNARCLNLQCNVGSPDINDRVIKKVLNGIPQDKLEDDFTFL